MPIAKVDERQSEFLELVGGGIEMWVEAGELLCKMVRDNPNAKRELLSRSDWLTEDILERFERIGQKRVYPYLMLDQSPGARRLIQLDFETQKKLYSAEIAVVTRIRGDVVILNKRLQALTAKEAETVFTGAGLRSITEQQKFLRPMAARENAHSPERWFGEAPPESTEETLDTCLAGAQAALIRARELMDCTKPGIDAMMTKALNAVGELRFALNP